MKYYANRREVTYFEKKYQIEDIGIDYYLENYLGYTIIGNLKNFTNEYLIIDYHRYNIAPDIIDFFIEENILYDLLKGRNKNEGSIKLFCKVKENIVIDLIAVNKEETWRAQLNNTEKQLETFINA